MRRLSIVVAVLSLAFASVVLADENPKNQPGQREERIVRYVLTPVHSLTRDEQDALRALGVTFEHAVPGGRYLVHATGDTSEIESAPTVARLVPFSAEQKIYRSAYAAAAQTPGGTIRLMVRFHDGVSLGDARAAIDAVGGQLNSPFVLQFDDPRLLTVRVPASSLTALARDERVMLVEALPRKLTGENAIAATVSNVTPLFSAPYGLSGNGVAMSIWELGPAGGGGGPQPQFSHIEFGGRYISKYPIAGTTADSHGTHTAGTIIAQGLNPAAKGMAPAATLNAFDATEDPDQVLADKGSAVPATGSVSDNNSWGFCIGWQPAGSGCGSGSLPTWFTCAECLGGYDGGFVAPYDKIARTSTTLYVHSAGNDATSGTPGLDTANFSPHYHLDPRPESPTYGSTLTSETFCYSKDNSGNDCPSPLCTAGISAVTNEPHCEKTAEQHPAYGPFFTLGLSASGKNIVAVGAVDQSLFIGSFSSRGPAQDGRVKPDLVAKGVRQYSTTPGGTGCTTNPISPSAICYGFKDGTSMAAPVVTGIAGLLNEQWRKTLGTSPTPQQLKTIMIAGADDLGNAGPDYTYGFGLADAKASADLIIADANHGNRIRGGTLSQKQLLTFPLTVPGGLSKLRVVLGWADPEVIGLKSDELADGKTLVNDLDVKVVGPDNSTVLPYVLDKGNPTAVAARGVNSVDNTEEVELSTPAAGTYQVVVSANAIGDATKSTQDFVLVANATLGAGVAPCTDAYEPNDTTAGAYGDVVSGTTLSSKICSSADVDFFRFFPDLAGTVKVHVTATDTPLTVTEFNAAGNATSNTINLVAGQTADLQFSITGARREYIRFAANGPVGATGSYTATFTYPFVTPVRRHAVGH